MREVKNFKLWTAIVTPLFDNGKIDLESLNTLLRRQEKAGNGVVVLGSTGEGLALDEDEKQEVVRFTLSQKLKVPVMAGVAGFNLTACQEWMSFCEEQGVDAYLMPVPLYAKPGPEGQFSWFEALLSHTKKPCMIYNVPSRTGVKLNPQVLTRLKGHQSLWSLKEASGSFQEFQEFVKANSDIAFYCGDDGLMPEFAKGGAVGLVSVASNVWPEAVNLYVQKSVGLKTEGLMPLWKSASDSLFTASNPVPAKALLHELGLIRTATVRPPLSINDLKGRDVLMKAHESIKTWLTRETGGTL